MFHFSGLQLLSVATWGPLHWPRQTNVPTELDHSKFQEYAYSAWKNAWVRR